MMENEVYAPWELEHGFTADNGEIAKDESTVIAKGQWLTKKQWNAHGRQIPKDAEPRKVIIARSGGHEVKLFSFDQTTANPTFGLKTFTQWKAAGRRVRKD